MNVIDGGPSPTAAFPPPSAHGNKHADQTVLAQSPNSLAPPTYDQAINQANRASTTQESARQSHADKKAWSSTPVQTPPVLPDSTSSFSKACYPFPNTFCMYLSSWSGRKYHLGTEKDTPLYAVSTHTGFSGKPNIVLHPGLDTTAPSLASVELTHRAHALIKLPAPPRSGLAHVEEKLECHYNLLRFEYHVFEVEVGPAGVREPFEWRHTSDNPKRGHGQYGDSGWKLVRLVADSATNGQASDGRLTSDGKEVVMTLSAAPASMTKMLYLSFIGSGAGGTLGDRWRLIAIMSARKYPSYPVIVTVEMEMADGGTI